MRTQRSQTIDYINHTFAPEDALLQQVRAVGESLAPGMQISPYEGKILQVMAQMVGARRILEIGSFVGYSTIYLARALPADGTLITLESNPTHAAYAREHVSSYACATVLEGDALALIHSVEGPLDVLFIDAEKRSYMKYLDAALPKLRSGAAVIADNSLLFGAVAGEPRAKVSAESLEVMRALNARLAHSDEFIGVMLPTEEGLTIGIRR